MAPDRFVPGLALAFAGVILQSYLSNQFGLIAGMVAALVLVSVGLFLVARGRNGEPE